MVILNSQRIRCWSPLRPQSSYAAVQKAGGVGQGSLLGERPASKSDVTQNFLGKKGAFDGAEISSYPGCQPPTEEPASPERFVEDSCAGTFLGLHFKLHKIPLLRGHEIHWKEAADDLHVRSRMKIQLLGGEGTATRQGEWKQELVGKVFSCDGSRHQIGTHCVGGFRGHAFRACTNSPKTAEHFGHITACEFDQDDVPWAYGIPRFDNLSGLLIPWPRFAKAPTIRS
jgi:hypothetical protein